MIKLKASFLLLFIGVFLIVTTSTYTHYKIPVNNDEWHASVLAKDIVQNGCVTNFHPFQSGDISKNWTGGEIKNYPRGLHYFISAISITSDITIFNTLLFVSIFNRLMLALLVFCLTFAFFKKYDVAFLSAIMVALIPSWGTGLGPRFVVASSLSYLFIITLLLISTKQINKMYLLLSFIFSLSIAVSHRTSTMILLFLIAAFLPYKDLRPFWVFSMIGIFSGILINMIFFNSWNLTDVISIDIKLIMLMTMGILTLSSLHQKYSIEKLSKMDIKIIVQKVLPTYFLLVTGLTFYIIYIAWKSPYSLSYFLFYTKAGYWLFGFLTIGYLGYISLLYSFFNKIVSKFVLAIVILLMASFLYFMDFSPVRTPTVYPRLFVYSAILLVPFTSKLCVDMFNGKNQLNKFIIIVLLVAALPYGLYSCNQSVDGGYYGDVEDISTITAKIISHTPHLNKTDKIILTSPIKYTQGMLYYGDAANFYVFPLSGQYAYWLNRHMEYLIPDIIIVPNNILIEENNIKSHKYQETEAHYRRVYEGRDATIYIKVIDDENNVDSFD